MPRQAQDASQPSFDVSLLLLGHTTVKAEVTKVANQTLRLVRRGGILDPVETTKVSIDGNTGSDADFIGANVEYRLSHLTEEAFIWLKPNETLTSVFDVSTIYALSPGANYTAVADGAVEPAVPSTAPTRSTPSAPKPPLAGGADARRGASNNFQKFFKTTHPQVLNEVASRPEAIGAEATSRGRISYFCTPRAQDDCSGNIGAVAYPTLNVIVNCHVYYDTLPEANYCGYLDQGGIALHEYSHSTGVFAHRTLDIVYGFQAVQTLDTASALRNADSFAFYASEVYGSCGAGPSFRMADPGNSSSTDEDFGSPQSGKWVTTTSAAAATSTANATGQTARPTTVVDGAEPAGNTFQDLIEWLTSMYNAQKRKTTLFRWQTGTLHGEAATSQGPISLE
ncbi:Deuterolysin metalloprotease family-domain-containing protein [Aspergillus karnatakaensis]|uniref:Deuterolysin metalloprotease family-domain-containing protein n=1 Tax=Aspergillus karnatakaensis TaxID=1810916 RepID=UPI003CCE1505